MSGIIINPYSYGAAVDEAYSFKVEIKPAALDLVLLSYNSASIVYNYDVDWGDLNSDTGVTTADKTHTYAADGEYIVRITGAFPGLGMYRGTTVQREQIISFLNWGTVPMKTLYGMFDRCTEMLYEATDAPNLSELDVAPVITSGNASYMFWTCSSITELDLSNWTDTDKITNLYNCFNSCTNLTLLNLTGWDTSNLTRADQAFRSMGTAGAGCEVIMPDLDWTGLTFAAGGFYQAFASTKFSVSPNLTNWVLPPAQDPKLYYLFYLCDGAVALDLSTWTNTSSFTNFSFCFYGSEFTSLNLTGWDTSNIALFNGAFQLTPNLTHITGLSGFDASNVGGTNDMRNTFAGTPNLSFGLPGSTTNFGVNWGTKLGGMTGLAYTFHTTGASGAGLPPDVGNWDVSGTTNFYQAFILATWNDALDFSNWDLSGMTASMGFFLYYNDGTTIVDFTNAAFPSTSTSMTHVFYGSEVEDITWGATCDFSNVTTMSNQCYGANVSSYEFNVTADFSSLAVGTNFLTGAQTMDDDPAVQTNYDNFLTRMNATWVDPGGFSGTLTVGASTYTGGGAVATARAALVTAGWTITDGGIA